MFFFYFSYPLGIGVPFQCGFDVNIKLLPYRKILLRTLNCADRTLFNFAKYFRLN